MKIYENIPNIITIGGLIIVNYSLVMYNLTSNIVYLIYMIIGFTFDYMDGYVSRKLKLKSDLGNILDKIVDKINQTCLLATIINKYTISKWYLILFFIREIIMLLLRKLGLKSKMSSFHGKLKTFIFPLSVILFHYNSIFTPVKI